MDVARAIGIFSDRLCAELRAKSQTNTLVSPLTIAAGVAMLLGGADGETANQLASAMALGSPREYPYGAVGDLLREVSGGALRVASRLWARRDLVLEPEFVSLTWHTFDAPCGHADFPAPAAAAAEINAWIEERTGGKIEGLVAPDSLSDAVLVLATAAHFKAAWAIPFSKTGTSDEHFTRADRSRVLVPMMHSVDYFPYADAGEFTAVELPYASTRAGEDLAMIIAVPREIGHLPELNAVLDAVSQLRRTYVALALPRFRFEKTIQLDDVLAGLGIVDAFSDAADFLKLTATELVKVSKAVHHALIDVNEAGTEAAAVTLWEGAVLSFEPQPEPTEVRVDRPFLFVLRDRVSSAVLFTGWLVDPTS